jgi:hypothetical protein
VLDILVYIYLNYHLAYIAKVLLVLNILVIVYDKYYVAYIAKVSLAFRYTSICISSSLGIPYMYITLVL